jgi:NADPH-dependent curcumin reductase CurA
MMLISMRIRMQGFVVFDFEDKYPEARKQLAQWLSEGKLKRKETIVKGGLVKAYSRARTWVSTLPSTR